QNEYKNWLFIRHEDLSREPIEEFRKLFLFTGLKFDDDIQNKIYKMTEGTVQSEVPRNANTMYININSRQNIYNWKKRLNSDQIAYIKSNLEPWWRPFYSDEDW
ncbi:MAG: sulfotransferase domain-containing protein, partial [Fidelibacterota bacterium]